ncbi:MAG: GGDEF domain-containing protein, partial [Gemmataceae bacterium]
MFAAWAEAEPDMPRLCAFSSLNGAGWEADSATFQDWLSLVWLPVPWPLDSLARWILFRALHGDLHQFENLPTDMALARRLEMLQRRNIDLARETVRLREQAFTCPLTGLPNRRAMDRVLAREFGQGPLRQPVALALVDIDHFKAWNERVLHTGGDLLLKGMGR